MENKFDIKKAQKYFNKAATHLATQRTPCIDGAGNCVYRNAAGKKCIFGIFIPDSKYRETIEGNNASSVIKTLRLNHLKFEYHQDFFDRLQEIHDENVNYSGSDLKKRLEKFAASYNLNTDVLDSLDWNFIFQDKESN